MQIISTLVECGVCLLARVVSPCPNVMCPPGRSVLPSRILNNPQEFKWSVCPQEKLCGCTCDQVWAEENGVASIQVCKVGIGDQVCYS